MNRELFLMVQYEYTSGKEINGDLTSLTNFEFDPRLHGVCAKIHVRSHFLNKHIKVKLKLLGSVVSSPAPFGLSNFHF